MVIWLEIWILEFYLLLYIYLSLRKKNSLTLTTILLLYSQSVSSLWQALTSRYGPYTILIPVFSIQEELRIPTILHIPRQFVLQQERRQEKKKRKKIFFSTSLLPIVKWLCCYIDWPDFQSLFFFPSLLLPTYYLYHQRRASYRVDINYY